jgi:ferritin-like metal-binding protein YciE
MAPKPKELNERDTKLVQWLNEAHAKEAELEADLTAHIGLTEKAAYKKRLQQHLKETREHKRSVARRIKQLGGKASSGPDIPGVPGVVGGAAGKTVAAVKGQVGAARALVTEQAETHVRNAQEELREEQVEIALYLRIETFATEVGDRDTATLAKRIRREEERMAKYLTAELPRLVKDVVRAEVPRDQRATATRSRRGTSRSRSTPSRSSSAGSRSNGSSASRSSGSSRSTSSRSASSRSNGSSRSSSASARKSSGSSRKSSGSARKSSGSSRSSASSRGGGSSGSRTRARQTTTA